MDYTSTAYNYKSLFEKALELAASSDQNPPSKQLQSIHLSRENHQEPKRQKATPGNKYQRYMSTSSSGSDSTPIERPWTAPNTETDVSHQRARSPVPHRRHSAKPNRKISGSSTRSELRAATPEKECQRNINNWLAFNENVYKRSMSADRNNLSQAYRNAVNRSQSPERAKSGKRGRSRQRKKGYGNYLVLNDGEVFSPILWRKFHIEDHLFDITKGDRLTEDEIKENINQMKIKYPHLTKYYDSNENYTQNSIEAKHQRLFNKPTNQTDDDKHAKQNYLWQRHVDMMKVSKSTSYYNFLSHFDRQSCRACSHSKTCTSKHCGSCDCGTECEKHTINVDFLKYRPYTSDVDKENKQSQTHSSKQHFAKQQEHSKLDSKSARGHGLTMQGFTIMHKTPDMGRKTLLSTHIDGQHCTSKSGHKKCLACAMAKENVLLQSRKKPLLHPKSAPAKLRRLNIVRSSSVPPAI